MTRNVTPPGSTRRERIVRAMIDEQGTPRHHAAVFHVRNSNARGNLVDLLDKGDASEVATLEQLLGLDTPDEPAAPATFEEFDREAMRIIQQWIDAVNAANAQLGEEFAPWAQQVKSSSLPDEAKLALIRKLERQVNEGLTEIPVKLS